MDDNVFFDTAYDGANRPVQLGANDAVSLAHTNYTPYGAPALTLRIANRVATAQGYDGVLRPTVRVHYFTPGTANAFWSYDFNAASQLSAVARDNDAFAWTGHYAVNRAYTTNGRNQYTTVGDRTYGYDANGNLTSDGTTSWLYDHENRLVGAGAASLVYDPLGRLFSLTSGSTTTTFLFDGGNLVAEYDGTTMQRRHLHWDGLDTPAVTFDGVGFTQPHWLHADERGTIVASSDGNGAATINRYDEYGLPASANSGRFGFTGQLWLPQIGLYYYRARIYSPTLGRFLQTDPIGYGGGMNFHAYVGNDPVNVIDPLGLEQCLPSNCATVHGGGPFVGGAGLGGTGGGGGSSGMIGQPAVSENPPAEEAIVVTALPRLEQAQRLPMPRIGPIIPFYARPPIMPRFPFPRDLTRPPAPGWRWRGRGPPGSREGNWVDPQTGESIHNDMNHPPPIPPHLDYRAPDGSVWRWFPDGTWEPKGIIV